ncbi:MAG: dynamin family protein [Candidatus Aquilonibacter sp.]
MDLRQYEQIKFALAEIVRSAATLARPQAADTDPSIPDVFVRLAEDRFNLVVVGRFNRGKTSLMNALLSTRRLPVGIVPLTSVITTVSYGSEEVATLEYHGRSIPDRVPIDALADYITEEGNPGNARGIRTAQVQLPSELLRRGFYFIDTPGIGSAVVENTRTTHQFLPEADAVLLVTSFESPLSEDEIEVIKTIQSYGRRLFFIVNKKDLATSDERVRVMEYVQNVLRAMDVPNPEVFQVSASGGYADGIPEFAHYLANFLIEQKHSEFLRVMCERIATILIRIAHTEEERANLNNIARSIGAGRAGGQGPTAALQSKFSRCHICEISTHAVVAFLSTYQHELVASSAAREELAERGGFCGTHAWQYDLLAGSRGACIAMASVLGRVASGIQSALGPDDRPLAERIDPFVASKARCPACLLLGRVEDAAIDDAARGAHDDTAAARASYCLRHFQGIVAVADPRDALRLAVSQADAMEHAADDMRRYILKFDATRRALMDPEERNADQRGLTILAGSRGINGIASNL